MSTNDPGNLREVFRLLLMMNGHPQYGTIRRLHRYAIKLKGENNALSEELTTERLVTLSYNTTVKVLRAKLSFAIRALIQSKTKHNTCEDDDHYSCPMAYLDVPFHPGRDKCECGAEEHNRIIDTVVTHLKTYVPNVSQIIKIESERDELLKQVETLQDELASLKKQKDQ